MSEIPAGWHDDPENPAQYRYWDGSQWTEHRAAKAPQTTTGVSSDAWSVVPTAFRLLGRTWRELVLLLLPIWLTALVAGAAALWSLESALEPRFDEIIERISEPGFDPVNNAADEAFVESIDFSLGATDVAVLVVAGLAVAVVGFVGLLAMTSHLAATHLGHEPTLADTLRFTGRRLPRAFGIGILWFLGYMVGLTAVALVIVLAALAVPLSLLLTIPLALALLISLYPLLFIAPVALAVGPTDDPPLQRAFAMLRGRWGQIAVRVLVLSLVLFGASIAVNFATAPIGAASVWAGLLAGLVLQSAYSAVSAAGSVAIYLGSSGPTDPALGQIAGTENPIN